MAFIAKGLFENKPRRQKRKTLAKIISLWTLKILTLQASTDYSQPIVRRKPDQDKRSTEDGESVIEVREREIISDKEKEERAKRQRDNKTEAHREGAAH